MRHPMDWLDWGHLILVLIVIAQGAAIAYLVSLLREGTALMIEAKELIEDLGERLHKYL
jgi:hypothetical protein